MEQKFPFEINKQKIFGIIAAGAVGLIVLLAAMVVVLREQDDVSGIYPTRDNTIFSTQPTETTQPDESTIPSTEATAPTTLPDDPEDPQPTLQQEGETVAPPQKQPEQVATAWGIDVSKYQGIIDWEQVAASGIDFAMIRVGYRTKVSGEITPDPTAKYNLQQALKYGINVGVYFFSTAVSDAEAREEASWVADFIENYNITYPVAYNCEGFNDKENRQYGLSKQQRTVIALAFLEKIQTLGYDPMFYASKSELEQDSQWLTSQIDDEYPVWVANYPTLPYPLTEKSSYSGDHAMWQYTASGIVPGIDGRTDLNVAYFEVDDPQNKPNSGTQEEEKPWEEVMNFKPVNEQVTAKEKTNLRDIPSQGEDATVLYTLVNGEIATRIGISDYGWSKLEFNGRIYYAVSSYLTTDLREPEYEIQTQFKTVNDQVTAKDVVNLRTLPSVTHEESQVAAQLTRGEIVTRTGINEELGWSRVEYNGQTLYCVSQYLMTAEELNESTTPPTETTPPTDVSEPTQETQPPETT